MINSIGQLNGANSLSASSLSGLAKTQNGDKFKNILLDSIDQVNSMQQQADSAVEKMATGGDVNPAEVLTAVQKADLAFKMMVQVRNKLIDAYQEIQSVKV